MHSLTERTQKLKKKGIKKTLKIIATATILLFGILWISSKFDFLTKYNSIDFRVKF